MVDENSVDKPVIESSATPWARPFSSAVELLAICEKTGLSISDIMLENEKSLRSESEVRAEFMEIWRVMRECVEHGCRTEGVLPGGLEVKRRAADYIAACKKKTTTTLCK